MEQFPRIVVLDGTGKRRTIKLGPKDLELLERYLPSAAAQDVIASGAFDQSSPIERLRRHAQKDPEQSEREQALELLRARLPADEFLSLCDALLQHERSPSLVGQIRYQRHLADPNVGEKEPYKPPSSLASQAMRDNPDDPQWARVREYDNSIEQLPVDQLASDFKKFGGMDASNLLLRREIVDQLEQVPDAAAARAALMELLSDEPDAGIRLRIVGALSSICEPGDLSAADFLERHLAEETNIRLVRPYLEYAIRYLRTGEE